MMAPDHRHARANGATDATTTIARRICAALAIVQAALLVLTGGGPTRAASVILAMVTCQVVALRLSSPRQLAIVGPATAMMAVSFAAHVAQLPREIPYRVVHVAVAVAYGGVLFTALAAALSRRAATFAGLLAVAVTAAVTGVEAWLDEGERISIRAIGGAVAHPVLKRYYPSDTRARSEYSENPRSYFSETDGTSPWELSLHDPGSAAALEERTDGVRIAIRSATVPVAFNIQLNHPGLRIDAGRPYALTFRVRSERPRSISYGISMAHDPWLGLGFYRQLEIATDWRTVSDEIVLKEGDPNARLHFDLGADAASVELDRIELRRATDNASIAPRRVGGTPSVAYRFNALGCRGADYAIPRPQRHFRILVLGDSHALGQGVHESDTAARRLEDALNRRPRLPGVERYEVINCSVAGYATAEELAFYRTFGVLYQPDLVLLMMTDSDDAIASDDEEGGRLEEDVLDRLFVTARLVRRVVRTRWQSTDFSATARALTELASATRTAESDLAIGLFRTSPLTRRWRDLSETVTAAVGGNVPVIDLGPAMLREHAPEALHVLPADQRPNEIAHRIAAVELERFLGESGGLVPRERGSVVAQGASPAGKGSHSGSDRRLPAFLAGTRSADPLGTGRVAVIAHRGDSQRFPENTLIAIGAAFDLGADVVEVDVQMSRDGVLVVFHDETLERTTNGFGFVRQHTLRELKELDAGAWKGPEFAGARVPTLEEVVRLARGRGGLLLDMKVDGLAQHVADVYARAGVSADNALIGAWTRAQRIEFVARMPGAFVLKTERAPTVWDASLFADFDSERLWAFEVDQWTPEFVRDAARHRIPVIAYTVNDPETMRRLIDIGISAIETDDPALLLRLARESGAR